MLCFPVHVCFADGGAGVSLCGAELLGEGVPWPGGGESRDRQEEESEIDGQSSRGTFGKDGRSK